MRMTQEQCTNEFVVKRTFPSLLLERSACFVLHGKSPTAINPWKGKKRYLFQSESQFPLRRTLASPLSLCKYNPNIVRLRHHHCPSSTRTHTRLAMKGLGLRINWMEDVNGNLKRGCLLSLSSLVNEKSIRGL